MRGLDGHVKFAFCFQPGVPVCKSEGLVYPVYSCCAVGTLGTRWGFWVSLPIPQTTWYLLTLKTDFDICYLGWFRIFLLMLHSHKIKECFLKSVKNLKSHNYCGSEVGHERKSVLLLYRLLTLKFSTFPSLIIYLAIWTWVWRQWYEYSPITSETKYGFLRRINTCDL